VNIEITILLVVAAVSIAGQAAAYWVTKAQGRKPGLVLLLVALAAGTMAGEAFLHAIPEAAEAWHGHDMRIFGLTMAGGFVALMILSSLIKHRACCDTRNGGAEPVAWTSIAGDAMCNFTDGMAISASFLISPILGIAATIAIVLHELPQEAGQCAILLRAGMRPSQALRWNAASAVPALAGAGIVLALPNLGADLERFILPAIAGAFLHIAFSDLLPSLRRAGGGIGARSTLAFSIGMAIMAAITLLE
jgi:zinc and cadmium transporter